MQEEDLLKVLFMISDIYKELVDNILIINKDLKEYKEKNSELLSPKIFMEIIVPIKNLIENVNKTTSKVSELSETLDTIFRELEINFNPLNLLYYRRTLKKNLEKIHGFEKDIDNNIDKNSCKEYLYKNYKAIIEYTEKTIIFNSDVLSDISYTLKSSYFKLPF